MKRAFSTLFNLNAVPAGAVTVTVNSSAAIIDTQAVLTVPASGLRVVLPITSPKVEYTDLADNYVEIPRPGRKPLLVRPGGKLRKVKLQVEISDPDPRVVEGILMALSFTASGAGTTGGLDNALPVVLTYAPMDSQTWLTATGYWRVTGMTVTSQTREMATNGITWASATVELTENSDPPDLSGALPFTPGATGQPSTSVVAPLGRSVSVIVAQSGDTLFTLAVRIYGAAEPGWRVLADANGIVDPRSIVAGQALRVPWAT